MSGSTDLFPGLHRHVHLVFISGGHKSGHEQVQVGLSWDKRTSRITDAEPTLTAPATTREWLPCIICLISIELFTLKTIRMAGRWSGCTLLTLDLATVPKHSSTICNSLS